MTVRRASLAIAFACATAALACTLGWAPSAHARATSSQWTALVRDRVEHRDFLGGRVLIRKIERGNLSLPDWYELREIVFLHPELGVDLILRGDRSYYTTKAAEMRNNVQPALMEADRLMLAGGFSQAFEKYQQIARLLRPKLAAQGKVETEADYTYRYVLHGMGRALFGARRFRDAWQVYSWINPKYAKFRQVLFERMWTSFKAGWIDTALGSIASQKSEYSSNYLEPESYLLQIYLYKVLCREDDLNAVLREIADFKWKLEKDQYSLADWARGDLDTRVLYDLTQMPVTVSTPGATVTDRQAEQKALLGLLSAMYASAKRRLIEDLTLAQAYSNLAVVPNMETGLKPIEKLPSRAALMAANLEIWPGDSREQWADELGYHRFIGESLCPKK